eukprot:GDKI01037326.1.p1 GENE.GDKI01037326.1~~GDKI01037326.1.p1  ORF type:complete len:280 (+),score=48.55 GDKI01037326.1:3-842(+)
MGRSQSFFRHKVLGEKLLISSPLLNCWIRLYPLVKMAFILVTGANGSCGLELVKLHLKRGDKVVAVCRKDTNFVEAAKVELKATDSNLKIVTGLDLEKHDTLAAFAETIPTFGKPFDLVVHNAGVLHMEDFGAKLPSLAGEAIEKSFATNAVGPLLLTGEMLKLNLIASPGKIALVSSRLASVDDAPTVGFYGAGGAYGYRMSKCALNMAGRCLSIDLKPKNIAVGMIHPGYVKTKMTGWGGQIEPQESAANMAKIMDTQLTLANTGSFWDIDGTIIPF